MPADQETIKAKLKASQVFVSSLDLYKIEALDKDISFSLFPGDSGQIWQSEAYLGKKVLFKERAGNVLNFVIGKDTLVHAKFLEVYTAITDVSKTTDKTNIRFELNGGVAPYVYKAEREVLAQGDSVIYKIKIFFTTL
jgi:hypothetical protein